MDKKGSGMGLFGKILLVIALVLAVIIFLWAKSFVEEQIQKDGQQIELICENVKFLSGADKSENSLYVQNIGSVPIYTIEIRVEGEGEIKEVPDPPNSQGIAAGQTANFTLPASLEAGNNLIVVPVLLGESREKRDLVPRACDVDYGVQVVIDI